MKLITAHQVLKLPQPQYCGATKKNSWIYLTSTYYWWLLRPMITIRFDSKFQIMAQLFDSIWFETIKHYSHSTIGMWVCLLCKFCALLNTFFVVIISPLPSMTLAHVIIVVWCQIIVIMIMMMMSYLNNRRGHMHIFSARWSFVLVVINIIIIIILFS